MKAIIVPGLTDLNKGDQALVWESYRLVQDLGLFSEIAIIEGGDTKQEKYLLNSQTREKGFKLIQGILKHPRRGKHTHNEHVKDSYSSYLRLINNGILDFSTNTLALQLSKYERLSSFLFDNDFQKSIDAFRNCDVVFVKGGGFLHSHGEFFSPYLIWYFLFYIRLSKKLGKKVIVLPNSFGPFTGLTVKKQIKSTLSKCELIYAREQVSSKTLSNTLSKPISVRPDLGFYLKPSINESFISSILEKYNLNEEDKIVGLTVRPWRFPGHSNPEKLYNYYLESIAKFAEYVTDQGYKVVVCNQSIGPNSHEDDRNAIKDLIALSDKITWINENLYCDDLKSLYSRFYCLLGTRFHSVIFSLTSSIPCIAIGYGGNKANGIMTDFNLSKFVLQIEDVKSNHLIQLFNEIVTDYDNITQILETELVNIYQDRNLMIDEIKSAIS